MRVKLKEPLYFKHHDHDWCIQWNKGCKCSSFLGYEFNVIRIEKGPKEGIDGLLGVIEIKYYQLDEKAYMYQAKPEEIEKIYEN